MCGNLVRKDVVNMNNFRAWDRELKLFPLNEEFLVNASHKLELITSLPFVHTARRYYRLEDSVKYLDWVRDGVKAVLVSGKIIKLYLLEEVKVVTRFP